MMKTLALALSQVLAICLPSVLLYAIIPPDIRMGILGLWAVSLIGVSLVGINWSAQVAVVSLMGKPYRFRPTVQNITRILGLLTSGALGLVNHNGGVHGAIPGILAGTMGVCMGVFVIVHLVDELSAKSPEDPIEVKAVRTPAPSGVSREEFVSLVVRVVRLEERVEVLDDTYAILQHRLERCRPNSAAREQAEPEQPTWQERLVREDD